MKYILLLILFFPGLLVRGQEPMKANVQNSAYLRWLNKEIHESRTLDNMESDLKWVSFTGGAIALVDSRSDKKDEKSEKNLVEINSSDKRSHAGKKSLLMRFPSKVEVPGPRSAGLGNCRNTLYCTE